MSSAQKTLYGILAFLPVVISILLVVQLFSIISEIIPTSRFDEPDPKMMFDKMLPFVMGAMFTGLISLASIIAYIVHAVNNKDVQSNERIMWILLFIFFGYISAPIYFFTRIVNDKPKDDSIPKI